MISIILNKKLDLAGINYIKTISGGMGVSILNDRHVVFANNFAVDASKAVYYYLNSIYDYTGEAKAIAA